jgi:hypothetical protein
MAARSVDMTLFNETRNTLLIKVSSNLDHGIFGREPPDKIGPQTAWNWSAESSGFMTGTEGWVRYFPVPAGSDNIGIPSPVPDGETVYLYWDNPYGGSNSYQSAAPSPYVANQLGDGSGDNAQIKWELTGAYGPDTCAPGYVWRDAFPGDHVCVIPDVRDQAAADNAAASQRVDPGGPYGPDSCRQGYVWREASPADHVCVTPDVRQRTQDDNATADQRTL